MGCREETLDMCMVHEQALEQRSFQGLHARYSSKVKCDSRVFLARAKLNSNFKLRMSNCAIKVCGQKFNDKQRKQDLAISCTDTGRSVRLSVVIRS